MKNFFTTLAIVFLFATAQSQNLTRGELINKAGIQRMLCFKMAKNFMAVGSGIKTKESLAELDEAAALFNENYNDLMINSKHKETKDALAFVGVLWTKFRDQVTNSPAIDNAASIITDANNLANACNLVTEKFVIFTNSKAAVLPNICGKQRMYSQKLAMLYIAKYWQVPYQILIKI